MIIQQTSTYTVEGTTIATLAYIIIGTKASAPLHRVKSVRAVAGRGLEGDRYFLGQGSFNRPPLDQTKREVSLISAEAITLCNERLCSSLPPEAYRRNLVISGLDLSTLKGKIFQIGDVRFRYVGTAPPCRHLGKLTHVDMMQGLKGLGGIRAAILNDGELRTGDTLTVEDA